MGRARRADFVERMGMFTGPAELKAQVGNVAELSGKLNRNLKGRVETGVGDMGVIGIKMITESVKPNEIMQEGGGGRCSGRELWNSPYT